MVGSKCHDFKNCEVSNVNAPSIVFLVICIFEVHSFFRASFLHPITDTDTDSMQGHAAQIYFKVEILLNNVFKHQADTIIRKQRILKENLGCIFVSYLLKALVNIVFS